MKIKKIIMCLPTYFNKYNPRSFYRIPKKPDDRRKSWIAAIKRVSPNGQQWEPSVATVMIFLLKHHIYLYFLARVL
jgi:hypothetical protein